MLQCFNAIICSQKGPLGKNSEDQIMKIIKSNLREFVSLERDNKYI